MGGYSQTWRKEQIEEEISWALKRITSIVPDYKIRGFASPEWKAPQGLLEILKGKGFQYSADLRCYKRDPIDMTNIMPIIGVNLLGEPGGVAYFENARVKGLGEVEIIKDVIDSFTRLDTVILYDHPYYAGLCELPTIRKIIRQAKQEKIEICRLEDLL